MNIGSAIKFCRQQRDKSRAEVATDARLSASYLSLLEQGKRDPSLSALSSIANALSVPLSVLLFVAADPSEIESMPKEISEKLAAATLMLLKASGDAPQSSLL